MLGDSFFEQGVTHEVCEDYARHGTEYAILSDGCSNGGGPRIDSDWGARLLVMAAEGFALWRNEVSAALAGIEGYIRGVSIPIKPAAYAATLLWLRPNANYTGVEGLMIGDGVVGGRRKDGSWVIHAVEFGGGAMDNSAPYYLKYRMFGENEIWEKTFGRAYVLRTYSGNLFDPSLEFPSEIVTKEARGDQWQAVMPCEEVKKELDFARPYEEFLFSFDEYNFVFAASDGVQSFYNPLRTKTNKHNEPIHMLDVLRVLMNIPQFRPGYMRQSRHWNFKQDRPGTFKRRNWLNGDDVSVGAVYCG